ncbi:MAG TPA: FkbM family methyltransferase [Chryseosolibacter sp.]|nr:FkbM family methyltransferase [Chryseosolibacter sp.]
MSIKHFLAGRRVFQSLFERLFRISLRGMNYGLGGIISSSGEINLVRYVKRKLKDAGVDNAVVFDVGANDGKYTQLLLSEFKSEAAVYCFEPSKFSFQDLQKELGTTPSVSLIPEGLGSKAETRLLYFDKEGSGWASVFERKDTGFNHVLNYSEEISLITLDDFCASKGITRIHFLKADVEGFELEIFRGAKLMLPNIDYIQFEFSFANYNSRTYLIDFFQILQDFRIYRVLQDGIHEIRYDPRYEVLMTTNYLAVNKRISS